MKEKEFDNLIKTKVDNLDNLVGIEFEEEAVWKKIITKIPKNTNGGLYLVVSTSIIILTGIIYFVLFTPNNSLFNEKKISLPVKVKKEAIIIDTMVKEEKGNIKKPDGSLTSKKNNLKIKSIKKEPTAKKNQIISIGDTVSSINKLNQKSIDTITTNEFSKVSNQNKYHRVNFAEITETRAYIHIYRPSKIVGVLNMFSLRANGEKIGTITNGEYKVFMVEPGLTEFEIKRKKIKINLEPRKSYYLRTELIFLGKTKFERVTESYAKKELDSMKK